MVKILLNENLAQLIPYATLEINGHITEPVVAMIKEFQSRVLQQTTPDGKVDPGGRTLRELRHGMSMELTSDKMMGIMSQATEDVVDTYYNLLVAAMASNQINTPMRVAHFLAQLGTESADFRYSEEQARLGGQEYEGRKDLGNTQPGDGVRFKGRGLIQLTGRANYTAYGKARTKDYITEPNNKLISSDPDLAVDVSVWYWTTHNLNRYADADDVEGVTRIINGKTMNGLADRKAHLLRAKCLLVR